MALQDIIDTFNKVNEELAVEAPEHVMALTADNKEYYEEQMTILEYSESEIKEFLEWLETQKTQ